MSVDLSQLKFDERGLIPAIVQDAATHEVLMVAYMTAESLAKTLETNETWFWSRSRSALWHKGETSGNKQRVIEMRLDCDADALVVLVDPSGHACHTGARSCFHRDLEGRELIETSADPSQELGPVLEQLHGLINSRERERPEGSYTTHLFKGGLDKILKKVGEESAEIIIAAKGEDSAALVNETSDLIYHLMVLLVQRGVTLDQVAQELSRRRGSK